jgi:hypothetical protein
MGETLMLALLLDHGSAFTGGFRISFSCLKDEEQQIV